jgi:hypothetical protein
MEAVFGSACIARISSILVLSALRAILYCKLELTRFSVIRKSIYLLLVRKLEEKPFSDALMLIRFLFSFESFSNFGSIFSRFFSNLSAN